MRRLVALLIPLVDIYVAVQVVRANEGMMPLFAVIVAVPIGIMAGAVVIFNLPFTRPGPSQDDDFGMYEPVGFGLGALGLLLFAFAPLFIAARGLFQGKLPDIGSGPDVLLSQHPVEFLLNLAGWVAIGTAVLWLFGKVVASRRASKQADRVGGTATPDTSSRDRLR